MSVLLSFVVAPVKLIIGFAPPLPPLLRSRGASLTVGRFPPGMTGGWKTDLALPGAAEVLPPLAPEDPEAPAGKAACNGREIVTPVDGTQTAPKGFVDVMLAAAQTIAAAVAAAVRWNCINNSALNFGFPYKLRSDLKVADQRYPRVAWYHL